MIKGNGHAAALAATPDTPATGCPLTGYQVAILQWAAHGKRDAEIASIMGNTTEGAIQQHMYRLLNLLGASSRTSAVAMALRAGWIK